MSSFTLYIISILLVLGSQWFVKSQYNRYSKVQAMRGYTGAQVAEMILRQNGLSNIHVEQINRKLGDHYDPRAKVVRLSPGVFQGRSIAAVSIAAHECGHALQDATDYKFMRLRHSLLVPANIGSRLGWITLVIGAFIIGGELGTMIMYGGAFLLLGIVAFQFVTLPVEIDASMRAMRIVRESSFVDEEEYKGVKNVLSAAALTYIAAFASTILNILRMFLLRRD
jgi:Zn-dependent membrane protease YugP